MYLTLGQAAKETGKSKSVISNALHSGRLSGKKNDKGGWEIDPAELFRVFSRQNVRNPEKEQNRTPQNTAEPQTQNAFLDQEIKHLKELLERERELNRDLARRLDQESEERRKLTMMLTDDRPKAPQKPVDGLRVRLGRWIAGKP